MSYDKTLMAKLICENLVHQNHMLEEWDNYVLYDDYDNKTYDCVKVAEYVIKGMQESS